MPIGLKLDKNRITGIIKGIKIKNSILIALFIVIFILLDNILGLLLGSISYSSKPNMDSLMWKDFYSFKKNSVDVMFLGSSHARFAFDTRIFDKELDKVSFDLATPDQTPVMGYYALKEALRYQKPKVLIYEAYWKKFGSENNSTPAYFVYDYIKSLDIKAEIIASLYDDKKFVPFLEQAVCRTYKYRDNLASVFNNLIKGKLPVSSNYSPELTSKPIQYGSFGYYQNGYFGSKAAASYEQLYVKNNFKDNLDFEWNKKQLDYFKKTLDLCKKNNIKVVVVTAPLPKPTMDFIKKYPEYSKVYSDIAKNYNLEYFDFNLENLEKNTFKNELFLDNNHLNSAGAKEFDFRLVPIIRNKLK